MSNQKLNDREEQVCIAALFYFLQHLNFWSQGKKYNPLNEHDILSPGHSKAYIITAIQKLSGQPITHAFQNPSPQTTEKREQERHEAIEQIRKALAEWSQFDMETINKLINLATLQI